RIHERMSSTFILRPGRRTPGATVTESGLPRRAAGEPGKIVAVVGHGAPGVEAHLRAVFAGFGAIAEALAHAVELRRQLALLRRNQHGPVHRSTGSGEREEQRKEQGAHEL